MNLLPLIRDTVPGIYQVCTNANTDYTITVPDTALGCILWFEDGAGTLIGGRIGVDQATTAVTGITGTDTVLGYHPAMPVKYELLGYGQGGETYTSRDNYLHVACATAGAVVRGMWLYRYDTGE
jgi:hypothetical protein